MTSRKGMTKHKSPMELTPQYAARGWPVLPLYSIHDGHCSCADGPNCAHPGEHPQTPNGIYGASTDSALITVWRTQWPDANIGIATGSVSGIFVLDVDGDIGKASLRALDAQHGPLPKTVTVKTGKGPVRRRPRSQPGRASRRRDRRAGRRRLCGGRWQRP
jgi:hypothetical protein